MRVKVYKERLPGNDNLGTISKLKGNENNRERKFYFDNLFCPLFL